MGLILIILILLLVTGSLPTWGYHDYGYGPSGAGGVVLLVILLLVLTGRL